MSGGAPAHWRADNHRKKKAAHRAQARREKSAFVSWDPYGARKKKFKPQSDGGLTGGSAALGSATASLVVDGESTAGSGNTGNAADSGEPFPSRWNSG